MSIKLFRFVLWGLVALSAAVGGYLLLERNITPPVNQTAVKVGGPFELVDHKGAKITQEDLLGRPHAIFFGFTNCPDICPTTLLETAGWLKDLGEDADKVGFYFFTVDPQRDTPEVLNDYVEAFDPRITAVTGTPENVRQTIRKYKAYAKKVDLGDGDYTMDHSASVMLFRADGSYKGSISYGENNGNAVAKLKNLINNNS